MIGYYVHHQGSGHLHRALAVARAWVAAGGEVTGLSSAARPADWPGPWVRLPLEDVTRPEVAVDPTAGGSLHWAPRGDAGLLTRQAAISQWLAAARPRACVVDVSAEVAWLVRLHGAQAQQQRRFAALNAALRGLALKSTVAAAAMTPVSPTCPPLSA